MGKWFATYLVKRIHQIRFLKKLTLNKENIETL